MPGSQAVSAQDLALSPAGCVCLGGAKQSEEVFLCSSFTVVPSPAEASRSGADGSSADASQSWWAIGALPASDDLASLPGGRASFALELSSQRENMSEPQAGGCDGSWGGRRLWAQL